ncbi:MAG TPA: 16S rRNA (cytidine(1402)-2'-O)-methyltransferase [Patescibacteria group bacterium]|nr:16S rRNA (cytidine(1402)-2'-O)-methyltransferase [Patescibacteria group bacterium]
MPGVLYMVATPIGNLGDISARAQEILGAVSFIACEDTRVTKKLLLHLSLSQELVSLHHHTPPSQVRKIVDRIASGVDAAYVSDAGTPGLADPGGKLVAAASAAGIKVVPIPGPSAAVAALSVAGLPANAYLFLGYPPHKKGRQKFFKEVAESKPTVVIFESTHRILKTLRELAQAIEQRPVVVARELTKMYETIYRGSAQDIIKQLESSSTKGELVIVVSPRK